jgi:hypothetical protein
MSDSGILLLAAIGNAAFPQSGSLGHINQKYHRNRNLSND